MSQFEQLESGTGSAQSEQASPMSREAVFRSHVDLRLTLLDDEKPAVRIGVANSLANEESLPAYVHSSLIEGLLTEDNPQVVEALARAIGNTGAQPQSLVAPLTTLLHHQRLEVAEEAARALGHLPLDSSLPFLPMFLTGREAETVHLRLAFAQGLEERGSQLSLAEYRVIEDRIEESPNKDITDEIKRLTKKPFEQVEDDEIAYVVFAATRVDSKGVKREAIKALEGFVANMNDDQKMAIAPSLIWAAPEWMDQGSSIQYRALDMLQECKAQLPFSGQVLLPIDSENKPTQMQAFQAYTACLLGGKTAIRDGVELLTEMAWSYSAQESERREAIQYLGSICSLSREQDAVGLFAEIVAIVQAKSEMPLELKIEALDTFGNAIHFVDESIDLLTDMACNIRLNEDLRLKSCQMLGDLPYETSAQKNRVLSVLHYLQGEPFEELANKARQAIEILTVHRMGDMLG